MSARDEMKAIEEKADNGEDLTHQERLILNARVDELNALSLAEAIGRLRTDYEERLALMEGQLAAQANIMQGIQTTLAMMASNQQNHDGSDELENVRRSLRRHLKDSELSASGSKEEAALADQLRLLEGS